MVRTVFVWSCVKKNSCFFSSIFFSFSIFFLFLVFLLNLFVFFSFFFPSFHFIRIVSMLLLFLFYVFILYLYFLIINDVICIFWKIECSPECRIFFLLVSRNNMSNRIVTKPIMFLCNANCIWNSFANFKTDKSVLINGFSSFFSHFFLHVFFKIFFWYLWFLPAHFLRLGCLLNANFFWWH